MKVEGDQDIPSALALLYSATLTQKGENTFCKKRSPFRNKKMQEGGVHVRISQKLQRERFKEGIRRFKEVQEAVRERWYAARPVWNSYLWYYDYYMLSALTGVLGASALGAAVIKSIQVVKQSVAAAGVTTFTIAAIDSTKAVVLPYGNSYISDTVQRGSNTVNESSFVNIALSPVVDPIISEVKIHGQQLNIVEGQGDQLTPYVSALIAAQLTVSLAAGVEVSACTFSWEVIERKSQTVYPVIDEINDENVKISWAKQPSVAANVSIVVVEYI